MNWLREVQWSPYAVGISIGVLSWLTWLISRKAIGCSTSFARSAGMIEKLVRGKQVESKPYYQEVKPTVDWQWMLVVGMVVGALISALLSGDFGWQWIPARWAAAARRMIPGPQSTRYAWPLTTMARAGPERSGSAFGVPVPSNTTCVSEVDSWAGCLLGGSTAGRD